MNIFYKVPAAITTYEQVDKYYANRKYLIFLYSHMGWEDKVDKEFMKRIEMPELKHYFNVCTFPKQADFMKNAATGRADYVKDTDANYEIFWNYDGNYETLAEFKRPDNDLFDLQKMAKFLRQHQSHKEYNKIMRWSPKRVPVSLQQAIAICEQETNVAIIPACTVFTLLKYKKFHIYDTANADNPNQFIGSFYFKEVKGQPQTDPLGQGLSVVKSPLTHQLTHELVHAVQNCFTPFYKHPKELIEIPAMMLETKYSGCEQEYIDRNIALSLADIESSDPQTFDKIFNEESRSKPPIKISNRFVHYIHYPRQYYAYTLGLIMPFANGISKIVRNPSECKRIIQQLLG